MESSTSENKTEANKMDLDVKENVVFRKVIFEPIRIGPVSTLDEMDCKVLQFQNKKLDMKLDEYLRIENELQQRIEQLEKRQSQDTIVLNVVNRYWNHLNNDVKTMLLEFDDERQNVADESNYRTCLKKLGTKFGRANDTVSVKNEAALAFVKTLAACNESQLDDKLIKNVEMSTMALAKIMQTYDHILRKYDETVTALKSVADNSTDSCETLEESDGQFRDQEDCKDGNKVIKRTKYSNTGSSSSGREYRSQLSGGDEGTSCEEARYDTVDDTSPNEKAYGEVVLCKMSASRSAAIGKEENGRTMRPAINSNCSENNEKERTLGGALEDASWKNRGQAVEDGIRKVVADIVDRVARKFEFSDGQKASEDCDCDLSDADSSARTESNVFEDGAKVARAEMADGEDDAKFHAKLSAVKISGDGAKEKSRIGSAAPKELKSVCVDVGDDNKHLRSVINAFQDEHRNSLANEERITEALKFKEHQYEQWKIRIDDIEYKNEKLKRRKSKIERHLSEAKETLEKIKMRKRRREKNESSSSVGKKFEELEEELDLQRKLACNRVQELELLREKYKNNLNTIEELEKSLNTLPEDVIEESAEYKCLQSQYSVLHSDTVQIKDQIEEYHAHIQTLNATFANKMEMTETEDLMTLRKLQTDLLQMQQVNSQLRREYQMLKIEFERNLVANEQTGPLNKEMRHLLVRLQKHNKHLKHEAQRYKRKYKELNGELNVLSKQSYNESKFKMDAEGGSSSDLDDNDYSLEMNYDFLDLGIKEEPLDTKKEKLDPDYEENREHLQNDRSVKRESGTSSPESPPPVPSHPRHHNNAYAVASSSKICSKLARKRRRDTIRECREILSRSDKKLPDFPEMDDTEDENVFEDEYVVELRSQLEKAETEQKELKLLLDTYKSVNRDKREKMQLVMAEKKLKNEIEETKAQMRRILEIKRENRKKLADEDALRKIKYLEEQNFLLLRQINIHKQEEEALLSEMEVTNQAFEDMQEQNSRLIQQLREKDDANSKLMAERIKSNLLYKITREEKESLQALIRATAKQLDSVTTVLNELEEKEQVYQTAINNVEKEINLRQQSLEFYRKRVLEYAHKTSELKLNLERYLADVKESKEQISETSIALDSEHFRCNRLQEEVTILQRQLHRMKKVDPLEAPDAVLVEQVREYKEMLTCQSCKVRRKDAVLSKCFHVFCWECLRTRYETRQRKCPKCNAAFGANDYHRLFFAN